MAKLYTDEIWLLYSNSYTDFQKTSFTSEYFFYNWWQPLIIYTRLLKALPYIRSYVKKYVPECFFGVQPQHGNAQSFDLIYKDFVQNNVIGW